MLVGAAVVQVGGHLGGQGGLNTTARCWGAGQDCLELSLCAFWGLTRRLWQSPPVRPQVRRARLSPLCAGSQCHWCHQCHTHNLHLAPAPAAVGGGEDGGAALAITGPVPPCQHAAHRQRVDAVGVAVAVAVVIVDATVAGGPDEDGAETTPSLAGDRQRGVSRESLSQRGPRCCHHAYLGDTSVESLRSQHARPIHGLTVIRGSPAGAVDVDVLGPQAEGLSLDHVCDGAIQHPHTCGGRTGSGTSMGTRPSHTG